ncbi:MAG: hypothetical protein LH609_18275 [Rudanella sp.]|nr:hypothetical protein [Rudanella sp.]
MLPGSIVNGSRSWSMMVHDFITDRLVTNPMPDEGLREAKKELIYGHLAYLTALRIRATPAKNPSRTVSTTCRSRPFVATSKFTSAKRSAKRTYPSGYRLWKIS